MLKTILPLPMSAHLLPAESYEPNTEESKSGAKLFLREEISLVEPSGQEGIIPAKWVGGGADMNTVRATWVECESTGGFRIVGSIPRESPQELN